MRFRRRRRLHGFRRTNSARSAAGSVRGISPDAARRVSSGALELDRLPLSQAGGALCEICGVGEKVSACVRLYGFGDLSAFPVDVWIRRSLQSHFEDGFDAMHAGIYGGVAQQYLFYYERYILAHRKK